MLDLDFLKKIVEIDAASGFEKPMIEFLKKKMVFLNNVYEDSFGNLICIKKGLTEKPKILISAHVDELGMLVKYVDNQGFIRFSYLGGFYDQAVLNQRVTIHTKNGPINGIIASKPPHLMDDDERKKNIKREDMFIDIGVSSKEEADSIGVRIGDPIVWKGTLLKLQGNRYAAKAFDNKIAVLTLYEVLKQLKEFKGTLFGAFTLMEEVGLRGAETSVYPIAPDIAISLDISLAGDYPSIKEGSSPIYLDRGPAITIASGSRRSLQGGLLTHPKVRDFLIDLADREGIPYQLEIMEGGTTDGTKFALSRGGIPTGNIGIPSRYSHTPVEIVSLSDVELTVKLLISVIKHLHEVF
ncbi:MAG: M42 family metallopeptidase [Candidatus Helarchaeota archaeon]